MALALMIERRSSDCANMAR